MTDISLDERWSEKGARYGVSHIYSSIPEPVPDYPPALLYVYAAAGHVQHLLRGGYDRGRLFLVLMKLPGIVADVLLGLLLFKIGTSMGSDQRGLHAAALYTFSPGVWIDSAVWGQTDSVYTLLLLAAAFAASSKRPNITGPFLTGAFLGVAAMTKFQSIGFLLPVALVAAHHWKAARNVVIAFAFIIIALLMPFILSGSVSSVAGAFLGAAGRYPVLSMNAFNVWWALFGKGASKTLDTGVFAGLSYRAWGLLMFAVAFAASSVWLVSRIRRTAADALLGLALRALSIIALSFFLLPTEIHERYLFPFLVFAAPWATASKLNFAVYAALMVLFALNLLYALPVLNTGAILGSAGWLPTAPLAALEVALGCAATYLLLKERGRCP